MKRIYLLGLVITLGFLVAFGGLPHKAQAQEVLYYVDSLGTYDGNSALYRVELNTGTGQAIFSPMVTLSGYNNVDVLAASPDGTKVFFIDDSSSLPCTRELGWVDVTTNSVHSVGVMKYSSDPINGANVGQPFINTDQGAIAPDGTFYITKISDKSLYTMDTGTAEATLVGEIRIGGASGSLLNVQGGDIAFDAYGTCYLWANNQSGQRGLYTLAIPSSPGVVVATYIGNNTNTSIFNGLAIRGNGLGDLVASQNSPSSAIRIVDTTTGFNTASFSAVLAGGGDFTLHNGDMSVGPLVLCRKTIGYWKTHDWGEGVTVTICGVTVGQTLGQQILWAAKGSNFSMFFAQLIAAKLNTSNATGVPLIEEAESILCGQPDVKTTEDDTTILNYQKEFDSKAQKRLLAPYWEALDDFNNTFHCD